MGSSLFILLACLPLKTPGLHRVLPQTRARSQSQQDISIKECGSDVPNNSLPFAKNGKTQE